MKAMMSCLHNRDGALARLTNMLHPGYSTC